MANPSWLTPELLAALEKRPAARAQFDPSIVVVKQLPPNWSGAYDPVADSVLLASDLTPKEAVNTVPHEFEHRAQNQYGTSGLLIDKETAVRLGDRRWNSVSDDAVGALNGNNGFSRNELARGDLERLVLEDRGLRDLAAKDDDYFYDAFGRKTKANIGAQTPVQGMVTPELQRQQELFQKARDTGHWDDVPSGGQSLIQAQLYNQSRQKPLTQELLRPRSKFERFIDYLEGLMK